MFNYFYFLSYFLIHDLKSKCYCVKFDIFILFSQLIHQSLTGYELLWTFGGRTLPPFSASAVERSLHILLTEGERVDIRRFYDNDNTPLLEAAE